MRLTKDKIIQKAIEVLDRDGLEGVTLRRLAKELDAQAGSIYYHIPDKESLIGEMANAILDEHFSSFDFEDGERDWAEWLNTLGHALRTAMLAHREGGRVVTGSPLGTVLTKLIDLTIRVLHNAGFDYNKASTVTVTVIYFTFGFVIEEQASPPPGNVSDIAQARPFESGNAHARPFEEFPSLMVAMEAWMQQDYGKHFDTSMRIIINGVRAELEN